MTPDDAKVRTIPQRMANVRAHAAERAADSRAARQREPRFWMALYVIASIVVAFGHDLVGGPFFEFAFAWMLAVPMLVLALLLPFCAFGLALGVIGGRR